MLEYLTEFARDPIGWAKQFGRLYVDEAKDKAAVVTALPGEVYGAGIDAVESLPFDTGLILTQSLSDPFEFGNQFVEAYPEEAERLYGEGGVSAFVGKWWSVQKWFVVAVVAAAVLYGLVLIGPALRGVSSAIGKAVG